MSSWDLGVRPFNFDVVPSEERTKSLEGSGLICDRVPPIHATRHTPMMGGMWLMGLPPWP